MVSKKTFRQGNLHNFMIFEAVVLFCQLLATTLKRHINTL